MGGGVERWAINMLSHLNLQTFDATLYETDFFDAERFDNNFIDSNLKNIKRVKIRSPDSKFRFMRNNILLSLLLDLLTPIILKIYMTKNKNSDNFNQNYDIVYLARNSYWRLFKNRTNLLVGSSHAIFSSDSLRNVIFSKLVSAGFFLRGIKAIHIYQGRKIIKNILSQKKDVFELPNTVPENSINIKNDGPLRFLFVGRLENYKGIDLLLDAWKKSNANEESLTIIGSGSLSKIVESEVQNGKKRISYLGSIDDDSLFKEYSKADVFLYPTKWDSLPTTILEALSMGLYVITSNSLKSTFKDEFDLGFIEFFEPSTNEISAKINEILQKRRHIRELRKNIIVKTREKYGVAEVERKFEDIIRNLVKKYSSNAT